MRVQSGLAHGGAAARTGSGCGQSQEGRLKTCKIGSQYILWQNWQATRRKREQELRSRGSERGARNRRVARLNLASIRRLQNRYGMRALGREADLAEWEKGTVRPAKGLSCWRLADGQHNGLLPRWAHQAFEPPQPGHQRAARALRRCILAESIDG